MTLRVARHANNLGAITVFYTTILGLEILGSFTDHDGYNGMFLGKPGLGWHLEFTSSSAPANHVFDEDDLLVFYPENKEAFEAILKRVVENNVELCSPANPYWKLNGTMFKDPDGYGVVVSGVKSK